jgi:hypothetical protein
MYGETPATGVAIVVEFDDSLVARATLLERLLWDAAMPAM